MVYSFEFSMESFIYYQSGCKTKEEARSKLEKISEAHCNPDELAAGKIYEIECGEFNLLEEYEISLRNGKLVTRNLD